MLISHRWCFFHFVGQSVIIKYYKTDGASTYSQTKPMTIYIFQEKICNMIAAFVIDYQVVKSKKGLHYVCLVVWHVHRYMVNDFFASEYISLSSVRPGYSGKIYPCHACWCNIVFRRYGIISGNMKYERLTFFLYCLSSSGCIKNFNYEGS